MNERGEVVYGLYPCDPDPQTCPHVHPFVWLPFNNANYDLDAGLYDLVTWTEIEQYGILRDINDNGVAVGQNGNGQFELGGEACVWIAGNGTFEFRALGTLDSAPDLDWSGAEAINNEVPPMAVGRVAASTFACYCTTGSGVERQTTWGFRVEIPSDPENQGDLIEINPEEEFGTNQYYATGVSDSDQSDDWIIAGGVRCTNVVPCVPSSVTCDSTLNGGFVTDSLSGDMDDMGVDLGAFTRKMSASGHVAGWARDYDGPNSACIRRAVFWESPAASIEDLADFLPQAQLDHPSRAEGVNDLALPSVVGMDTGANIGVLWESNGDSTWTPTNLEGSDVITHPERWEIQQTHAVNDGHWIAAFARDKLVSLNDLARLHVVVLVPFIECEADLNDDDRVNSGDLLIVINHWGSFPSPPDPCPGDINEDGLVNTSDLLNVLNHWGVCAEPIGTGGGNNAAAEGGGPSEIDTLLQILQGLPNIPQEVIDAIEEYTPE